MLRTLLILTSFSGSISGAWEGCDRLLEAKQSAYGFAPASLSRLEKTAKIPGLDRFWNLAKSDARQSIACLQGMLEKDRKDSFFLFDASELLFSLDKSAQSAQIVAEALSHVDLDDIKPYDYVALAIEVSKAGADISSAAMHFARSPKVDDYTQASGVRMNREQGVVALFGRLPTAVSVTSARALYQSGDVVGAPYGLLVLSLALAPDALAAVRQAGDISAFPVTVRREISALITRLVLRTRPVPVYQREQLLALLKSAPNYGANLRGPSGNQDFMGSALTELQAEDSPLVREARRRSIVDPSMYSILQYYAYTQMLHVVETRAGLFDLPTASAPPSVVEEESKETPKPQQKQKSKRRVRKK